LKKKQGLANYMKVILLQKVPGIGDIDDVKEVADGYARNFLFPRHLAVQASPQAVSEMKAHQKKISKESEQDLKDQQILAEKLDGLTLEVKEKGNDSGKLYAAIGPARLVSELKKKGITVNRNQIEVEPIKEAGDYEATIRLRHGLEATISITVSA
jgi:large subunit ribosomal protein L9